MKETGLPDCNGDMIHVGDILLNPMMYDLWKVEETADGNFTVNLIPNSGYVGHPDDAEYPLCIEDLDMVNSAFEIYNGEVPQDYLK
jgi:hypothetical protein